MTECISLLVCIAVGFLIGSVTGPTAVSDDWPTQEMMIRGTDENFYIALPIAFASGLGVAVSLLDDQTSSLVGVAISASLLPPAVNAGVMWIAVIYATTTVITPSTCYANTTENFNAAQENLRNATDDSSSNAPIDITDDLLDGGGEKIDCSKWFNSTGALVNTTLWLDATESGNTTELLSETERIQCLELFNITDDTVNAADLISTLEPVEEQGVRALQKNPFEESEQDTPEEITPDDLCSPQEESDHGDKFYRAGAVSLFLTLANILLIWLSGMFMFRMKEVLPIKKTVFWEDLGIARRVYTHRAVLSSANYSVPMKKDDDDDDDEGVASRV